MMQAPPDAETPFIPPVGTPHHSPCTTLRKRSKETDKHYKDCQEFVSSKAAKHPSSKETEIEVNLVVIADKDRQFKKERARPRSACEKDVSSSYSEKNVFCFDEHSLRDADLSGKESSSEKEKAGKFLVEGVRVDKAKHFDSKDGGDKLRDSYSADCWKEGRVESGRWEFAADGRTFRPVGEDRREWTAGGMKEQPAQERRTMADDDVKYHHTALLKSSSQRLAGAAGVLHVTLPPPSMATSTPTTGSYTTELQWGVQQTPPPGAPPHSPGALSWHGEAPTSSDKSSETIPAPPPVRLSRKESYKAQRQNYRREKKRAATALLSTLEDPAVLILADWLKVRGSLKSWTKLWCVLKPGLLLLYKSPKAKSNHWVGTVLLSACHVIERPSKKDGFCFKLYNPLEKTIWAPRGPHNETIGAVVQPLPTAHLIFRAPSQAAGKCWLDGLELALRCSNTLLRSGGGSGSGVTGTVKSVDTTTNHETQWSPEDLEKHFNEQELDGPEVSDSDSEGDGALREAGGGLEEDELEHPGETSDRNGAGAAPDHADGVLAILKNVYADEDRDDVGQSGEVVEELGEENKSLLWFLIKQVRPGMDLSKVVLPTFILEPRSFLDKLADSFYHSDILARACRQTDAFERMKTVVTWYLSGLYRKPKGLKKPYNPVLGEAFRCCWIHPGTNTRTYYVAEQVSHHPPVSAFYVSNRKEGFAIEATILAKSKFYGNSTSAILEGIARVALLPLGESYLCSSPYAHCKGLLLGTLSMELGGRVTIYCPNTDYLADIEFKLKPFLGGSDCINMVSGRIKHHKETVATLEGHWDGRIDIKDKKTQEESPLLDVADLKQRRLRRQLVVPDRQGDFESQRLWRKVSQAIAQEDQVAATEEKTSIEEAQRERAREAGSREWVPKYFARLPPHQGLSIPQSHGGSAETSHPTFQYNFHNFTAWDEGVDVLEYEEEFVIKTLRRQPDSVVHQSRQQLETEHSGSESDSTNSHHVRAPSQGQQSVAAALLRLEAALNEQKQALAGVSAAVHRLEYPPMPVRVTVPLPSLRGSLIVLVLAVALHLVLLWVYSR